MNRSKECKCFLLVMLVLALVIAVFTKPNDVYAGSSQLVPLHELSCYGGYKKYMDETEFQQAYQAAVPIVKPLLGLPIKEQVVRLEAIMRKGVAGIKYTMKDKHYNDPYGYFVLHLSSCAGCTRATGMCLNMLGIEYEHVNPNEYKHQWCRIKIGDEYWICDAFGHYAGPEPAPYDHPTFPQNEGGQRNGNVRTIYIPLNAPPDIGRAASVRRR